MLDSRSEAFQNVCRVTLEPETEASRALVGSVLAGRYRIERLLGSGGMGAVYRAEHVLMRKACAVKVLHREMTQVKEVVARFEREAVAAARIEHPNVATATDFGQLEDGSFYLVLEFIEGQSLSQRLADVGALQEERALLVTRQICDGLAAAHAAGIIHRDLKPDNVMLLTKDSVPDFVKVLDFGIAKLDDGPGKDQQALTRLNTVMGTPEYMAPEQARGEPVDHRADLYTVGAILFEMLAGTSPFRSDDFVVVLTRKLTEDAPALPAHVSPATQALVAALLRRTPSERPQSALEVVALIDAILGYSPTAASMAFSPISGQLSPPTPKVSAPNVAFANTLIGDAPIRLPRAARFSRLTALLAQALSVARRPVAVGARQVPLGFLGGALLGLPLLLTLGFSALSSGAGSSAGSADAAGEAAAAVDDLPDLIKRAEAGDRPALAELLGRAQSSRNANVYRALGRGYFKLGQLDAGLRAYRSGAQLDPKFGELDGVIQDVRRASADLAQQTLALELAAELGAAGADLLYELWDASRGSATPFSKQAKALLDTEAVQKVASPSLKVALELPRAKSEGCTAVKKLLPRVIASGDARVGPTLARLGERRGCGFLGLKDCFGCLRASKDLATAQKTVASRPGPVAAAN